MPIEHNPSCDSAFFYDGIFSSQLRQGEDVMTVLLCQYGIRVLSQHQLKEAGRLFDSLDTLDRAGSSIGKP